MVEEVNKTPYSKTKESFEKLMKEVLRDIPDEETRIKLINGLVQLREILVGK